MIKFKSIISILLCILICFAFFTGCGKKNNISVSEDTVNQPDDTENDSENNSVTTAGTIGTIEVPDSAAISANENFSDYANTITLNGDSISFTGNNITVSGTVVTINAGGEYLITGSLDDGQIIVDSADLNRVKLIFNGVDINCKDSAPIYIICSEDTVITLAEGSVNLVSDGGSYVFPDSSTDKPDAAVFSSDDLKIKGAGTLYVTGNYMRGIFSKDDLVIEEAAIHIISADDGLRANDSVKIISGNIYIRAGADGIRTNNGTEDGKGNISIFGGHIEITAALDGIQAATDLTVTGGTVAVFCGGGSANSSAKLNTVNITKPGGQKWGSWGGGGMGRKNDQLSSPASEDTASAKALKAAGAITISGGTLTIDSSDDSVHSADTLTISGGSLSIASGDDGLHSDDTLTISGGTVNIIKSYEGIEAANLYFKGGNVSVTANDDGVNGAGGNDTSGSRVGGRGQFSSSTGTLTISGGTYVINSAGDGIDVNGSISMSGGNIRIFGPTVSNNGALDYDGSFSVTGGTIIAFGSTGMAQSVDASNQSVLFVRISGAADSTLKVTDESGNVICEETSPKAYGCVVITSSLVQKGNDYTFCIDGDEIGTVSAS